LEIYSFVNDQDALPLMNGLRVVVFIYKRILFSHKVKQNFSFVGKLMELENIILNKISHVQKDKGHIFSLIGRK
jgi:hypothetical protein